MSINSKQIFYIQQSFVCWKMHVSHFAKFQKEFCVQIPTLQLATVQRCALCGFLSKWDCGGPVWFRQRRNGFWLGPNIFILFLAWLPQLNVPCSSVLDCAYSACIDWLYSYSFICGHIVRCSVVSSLPRFFLKFEMVYDCVCFYL